MQTTYIDLRGTRATYGGVTALLLAIVPSVQTAMNTAIAEGHARLIVDSISSAEPMDRYDKVERVRSSPPKDSGETELMRMLSAFANDKSLAESHPALSARLIELREEVKSEPDHTDLSAASLLAFHQFMRDTPLRASPFVTLTDSGELYATWASGKGRLLSLRFFSPSAVAYVMFKPVDGGTVARSHGSAPLRDVSKSVGLPTLDWIAA